MLKTCVVTAAVLAAATLTACGSSDSESTDGGLTGTPVKIGAQATTKGPSAYPETADGLKAAEWYVNNERGGINGKPLEIDVCDTDGSPESGINCANGFVSSDVAAVIDSYDASILGSLPVLQQAQIPILGTLSVGGPADSAPYGTSFYTSGPTEVSALGSMTVIKELGENSASLAIIDIPAGHTYVDKVIKPIAEKVGIDLSVQYVPGSGANFNVVAAGQLSEGAAFGGAMSLPEESCTQLFQALRQQNFEGPIFAASCNQFIDEMGADAAGAVIQPRLYVPKSKANAPSEVVDELEAFENAMEETGNGDKITTRSLYSFAAVVNLANALTETEGTIDAAAVTTALSSLKDFPSFAGPEITCDGQQWPGRPTACSNQSIFFEVTRDGELEPIGEGFSPLDTALLPSA